MLFSISAYKSGTSWTNFGKDLTRGEARDWTRRLQNAGAQQIIVSAYAQDGTELWQHVWHSYNVVTGSSSWDNLHTPTMTYFESDLVTKSASQPYTDSCEHGLSAWLCADPVNHYSDH